MTSQMIIEPVEQWIFKNQTIYVKSLNRSPIILSGNTLD